ncbi:MAG: F0F1 ATP synthase subunit epsilon [Hydrogenophaga sp.]|uniref:F0F1 ATP synthase subunit epsilon n=1 Tax=Hydrogenophaga sp. TaxID=1904254 RepID=UPI001D4FB010|nr:F0F1 ATP synthase subunit epsilon [Hydrogenophaga sp.]MBX3611073.1 F0F1 ATP synthase subunit epsilon [Hydrogenophaga sp.]
MSGSPPWPQARDIHLRIADPGAVAIDAQGIRSVRASDASGGFGLWPGHEDLLAVLTVGVVSWRDQSDQWHHCAVRGGVLAMRQGNDIHVATREAIAGDDLQLLEQTVIARLHSRQLAQDEAQRETRQLELRALRELMRPLRRSAVTAHTDLGTLP